MADPLSSQNYQQHQIQQGQGDFPHTPVVSGVQRMPSPHMHPNGSPLDASPVPGQHPQQLLQQAVNMPQQFKNQPPGQYHPPPANGISSPGQRPPLLGSVPPVTDGTRPPFLNQATAYQPSPQTSANQIPNRAGFVGSSGGQFQPVPQFSNSVMNGPSNFPPSYGNAPASQNQMNTSVNRFMHQQNPPQGGLASNTGRMDNSQDSKIPTSQQQTGMSPVPLMPAGPSQSNMPPPGGMPQQTRMPPPPAGTMTGPSPSQSSNFQPPQGGSFPPPPKAGFPPSNVSAPPPPPQAIPSQTVPGSGPPKPNMPPSNMMPPVQGTSRPNELPVPYHGHGQYSHQVGASLKLTPGFTPNSSDPPSQKSSRAPSPVSMQSIDALEGQFTPTSQGGSGMPPSSGIAKQPPTPGQTETSQKNVGITGRRQYPQMGSYPPTSGPPVPQPGMYGQNPQPTYGVPPTQNFAVPATQPYQTNQMKPVQPYSNQPQSGSVSGPMGTMAGPVPPTSGHVPPSAGHVPPSAGHVPPSAGPMLPPVNQGGFNLPQPGQQKMMPQQNSVNSMAYEFGKLGVNDSERTVNVMQEKTLIPPDGLETVKPTLQHDFKNVNCNPEIFRCTLRCIPQTASLLSKSRLPLGILIHPFKDLSQLPVIQSSVIVRCRSCRTYINPFVHFLDQRRWKCNLCYRVNELPEEFSFDPVSKTYGDPQRRPEVRSSTIEFIAPSEYMLRPPQPAVYLFLLDVSFNAVETGYLSLFCQTLLDELDKLPGDSRTQIGFVGYDRFLYFFSLEEGLAQPQMMIVPDLEDVFLPCPDNLLVNLHESKDLVIDLLSQLPTLFESNGETGSALGAALQAAFKLMSATGGRVTVMQTVLPTVGPGALQVREMPTQDLGKNIPHLGPATDFYKKLALDFSAQQIAVDLFMLNGQYADLATLACISKYSGGCIQYYPSFHTVKNTSLADKFDMDLRRYFTRKIGFEAVMRIRCTRGLSIHTFHGNFFVRSTDLLSLPNINPDAGFGMQMSIEDNLTEVSTVCFQAALLYTSSKGERRIRVHTLCLPVTSQISDVFGGADQQAIISLLAKMAVDRSVSSSVGDAKDAMINAALDATQAYAGQVAPSQRVGALLYPFTLRCMPLFILALIKSNAFRLSPSIKLDERVFLMQQFKSLPCNYLLQLVYPNLYPVHNLEQEPTETKNGVTIPKPPVLQLTSANIDRHGVYLMDSSEQMLMLVGGAVSDHFCQQVFDKPNFMSIPDGMTDLPELENPTSENVRNFVNNLTDSAPSGSTFHIIREDSKMRYLFFEHMIEDRTDSSMSYYEFLQYLQQRTKS